MLAQIGWRGGLVDGGDKSYRRLVVRAMYDDPLPLRVILLDGGTGTAKTQILQHLAQMGQQVLDLEGMAQHRGSLLGGMGGGQPSQKAFESRIAMALADMDPALPVFIEAESNKIGARIVPPSVWQAMLRAAHVRVSAPLDARAAYLVEAYQDLLQDAAALDDKLSVLARFHGHERVAAWQNLAAQGAFTDLAAALVQHHYDPSYGRSSRRAGAPVMKLSLPALSPKDLRQAAAQIATLSGTSP
jgi:tRNA 2-selenouridine synthase